MKRMVYFCAMLSLSSLPLMARALGCGDMSNGVGPFDNRTMSTYWRGMVEGAHFTPKVETLTSGKHSTIAGDIDYTLRAIPNEPRALLAMSRLGLRTKSEQPQGALHSIECYFQRAIEFVPDDPMPHLIYSIYLKDRSRKVEGKQQLEQAEKLKIESDSYEFPYNMALEYFDYGDYDKSLEYAHQAYQLGAPFPGLRRKLTTAGKWKEAEVKVPEVKESEAQKTEVEKPEIQKP